MLTRRGLVLGGGGITGIAWELGFLLSLLEAGLPLQEDTAVLGTSAGSVTGTLLTTRSESELHHRLEHLVDFEVTSRLAIGALLGALPNLLLPGRAAAKRVTLAAQATRAHPGTGRKRHQAIRRRLDVTAWPEADLRITAVNGATGELTVFTRDSGVDINDAVAASCAVPFVWPPVRIQGTPYIDGGVRTPTNVDQMTGFATLLVLAPIELPFPPRRSARRQVIRSGALRSLVVAPDRDSRRAIGRKVLDLTRASAAGQAGLSQGRRWLNSVTNLWEA